MKTISVAVSSTDYETYRQEAKRTHRSIAQLIREAMAFYRSEHLERRTRLADLPVLAGHKPKTDLPSRHEIHEEIFISEGSD
jgi:FAD/FMN-containing dehydrogenase